MTCLTPIRWRAHSLLSGAAAVLALAALTAGPLPAQAGVWISAGGACCGYWGPGPYWGSPPPYAYYPPPAYYPAPVPGYYPPPAAGYYPPPTPTESAYPAAPAAPMSPGAPLAAQATPRITYTGKPAFTNSTGQTCREYKTSAGGRDVFGTACREADGQWRVVN